MAIPTLNEEATLAEFIAGCRTFSDDILVIDGHSTDNTVKVARSGGARVIFDHRNGKGEAIRTAVSHIQREVVVFIDADGSHDPNDIPSLIQPILKGKVDHVSGSRLLGGSSELHGGFDECFRLMGSSLLTALINHRFKVHMAEVPTHEQKRKGGYSKISIRKVALRYVRIMLKYLYF